MNVDLCEEKEPKAARLNQDTWSIEVSTWSIEVLERVNMRTDVLFFFSIILVRCIL